MYLKITIEENLEEGKGIRDFIDSFIAYASSFSLKFGKSESKQKRKKQNKKSNMFLEIMVAPNFVNENVSKTTVVYGRFENIERFINALRYFRFNELSVISEVNFIRKLHSEIKEAWLPSWLASAHKSLKKAYPILKSNVCQEHIRISVPIGTEKFFALLLVSLLTGGHRRGISLRQIAAQNLVALLTIDDSFNKILVESIAKGLATLVTDTYVWLPRLYVIKRGVFGSEIHYSLAALELDSLINEFYEIYNKRYFMDKYVELLENSYCELRRVLTNRLSNDPIELARTVSNTIRKSVHKVFCSKDLLGGREVLFGYYEKLEDGLRKISEELKEPSYRRNTLLTVLTEQTSLLYVATLVNKLGFRNIIFLYTPQVLYERLLLEDFIEHWNSKFGKKYKVEANKEKRFGRFRKNNSTFKAV